MLGFRDYGLGFGAWSRNFPFTQTHLCLPYIEGVTYCCFCRSTLCRSSSASSSLSSSSSSSSSCCRLRMISAVDSISTPTGASSFRVITGSAGSAHQEPGIFVPPHIERCQGLWLEWHVAGPSSKITKTQPETPNPQTLKPTTKPEIGITSCSCAAVNVEGNPITNHP